MFCTCLKMHFYQISETVSNLQSWHEYMVAIAIFNIFKGCNSKSRLTRARVLVFCTSSYGALHLWEISWDISNCVQRTERTRVHGGNGYAQCSKDNNSKSRQIKSYSSWVLHIFSWCFIFVFFSWCFIFVWHFVKISRTVSELWSGHEYIVEMAIFNIYDVQRAVTLWQVN